MKINNEKIIFDTINSIGEKNVSKYLSLEEKINLRQIFSNYLNNGIKLDDSKSGVPFQSGYLCSGIFENQLNFEPLNKK